MLACPTPFPMTGSYALFVDTDRPLAEQRAELARIMRRNFHRHVKINGAAREWETVAITLPLRDGASGNRVVEMSDLIDATALTSAERGELDALRRDIANRPRIGPSKIHRAHALGERDTWAPVMAREMAKLGAMTARTHRRFGASAGAPAD